LRDVKALNKEDQIIIQGVINMMTN